MRMNKSLLETLIENRYYVCRDHYGRHTTETRDCLTLENNTEHTGAPSSG